MNTKAVRAAEGNERPVARNYAAARDGSEVFAASSDAEWAWEIALPVIPVRRLFRVVNSFV
jgi:hypothetical protein